MNVSPRLSILIVSWNSAEYLRACLASIPRDRVPLEIIVVDNASADDSVQVCQSFGDIRCISSPTNLGFAAANNLAAAQARGEYLLLLNPDTTVPPGALEEMIEFCRERPQIGSLGPQLRNPDGSIQRSCWRGYPGIEMALSDALYLWKIPWLPFARTEYRPDELRVPRRVDHLLGACLLIRRAAWEQVGPLDGQYFLFLEETDWCWRAHRAGWELYYLPSVWVTHYGQQSMRLAPRRNVPQFYKSYVRFDRLHHSGTVLRASLLKGIIAIACALRIGMWRLRARRATAAPERTRATAMASGYWQTLTELHSY